MENDVAMRYIRVQPQNNDAFARRTDRQDFHGRIENYSAAWPDHDGFAACQAIRALPAGRNIPILMATGLDDVESIDKAYRVGATDFITKPVSYPLLPHRLRYMLRAHQLAEAQRIAGLAHLRWVPKSPLIDCSPDLSRMFGLSAKATRSITGS